MPYRVEVVESQLAALSSRARTRVWLALARAAQGVDNISSVRARTQTARIGEGFAIAFQVDPVSRSVVLLRVDPEVGDSAVSSGDAVAWSEARPAA